MHSQVFTFISFSGIPFTRLSRWGARPNGAKELFNYRHSSLYNVSERCFHVLKIRFPVLKMMSRYKPCRQGNLIRACCTIHNFVRMGTRNDRLFREFDVEDLIVDSESRYKSIPNEVC
jgi:hypothetical protein